MNGIEFQRKKSNLTQKALAQLMGVTQANVSQWENGTAYPATEKLPELAKVFGCTIDDLFFSKEKN